MNNNIKFSAFEYLVSKLCDWYFENNGDNLSNDLSKLKITKLLFFTAAISSNRNEEGLLSIFNNFVALPYGHVESDVYENMDDSVCYSITKNGLILKSRAHINEINLSFEIKMQIDEAISKLKAVNCKLINYKAFDLVDISHKWSSWKMMYSLARKNGKYSMKIPKEMIMTELKTFVI